MKRNPFTRKDAIEIAQEYEKGARLTPWGENERLFKQLAAYWRKIAEEMKPQTPVIPNKKNSDNT